MLDACICSSITETILKSLRQAVLCGHYIVVSATAHSEIRFGATEPKASPRRVQLANEFCARLNVILLWDYAAADSTTEIKVTLQLT